MWNDGYYEHYVSKKIETIEIPRKENVKLKGKEAD